MSDGRKNIGPVSFALLLTGILFIAFKLANLIDWDWVWVLSPFWVPIAFMLSVIAISASIWVTLALVERIKNK